MKNPLTRLHDYIVKDLWKVERSSLDRPRAFLLDVVKMFVVIVRNILYGQMTLWAMGLVYTTLVSLVPLLAVAFSVLKAFGVQNKLEPFLLDLVAPLGANGPVLAHRIVEFVNNMRVGVLGVVGLGLLMYTVMSLIQKIEHAFNTIWRVPGGRSIFHQFTEYLSVVLVGPVLIVSALALTASLMSTSLVQTLFQMQPIGTIIAVAGKLTPYVLVCGSFTFLYYFLPNTHVRLSAAIAGGLTGGILWESVGWGFASFIVASTRYAAIYSSFAILILFMTWLYLSWLILLVGAEVSFYYQNPQFLSVMTAAEMPDARLIEQTAVSVMFLIASNFYRDRPPWTVGSLALRLGLTTGRIEAALAALKQRRLILEIAGDQPGYVPARDLDTIRLQDVYDAVRRRPSEQASGRSPIVPIETVERMERDIDESIQKALEGRSLKDVVRSSREGRDKLTAA